MREPDCGFPTARKVVRDGLVAWLFSGDIGERVRSSRGVRAAAMARRRRTCGLREEEAARREEPDGVWFNPSGLFDLADGGKVETAA